MLSMMAPLPAEPPLDRPRLRVDLASPPLAVADEVEDEDAALAEDEAVGVFEAVDLGLDDAGAAVEGCCDFAL